MKTCFIVNPNSANGATRKKFAAIQSQLALVMPDMVVWFKDGAVEKVARKGEFEVEVGTIDGETLA